MRYLPLTWSVCACCSRSSRSSSTFFCCANRMQESNRKQQWQQHRRHKKRPRPSRLLLQARKTTAGLASLACRGAAPQRLCPGASSVRTASAWSSPLQPPPRVPRFSLPCTVFQQGLEPSALLLFPQLLVGVLPVMSLLYLPAVHMRRLQVFKGFYLQQNTRKQVLLGCKEQG